MDSNLFLSISAEQITNYLNLGLIGLIGLGVIGFLIGFIQGFWKKSFSFCYFLIGFILLICFVKPIFNFVYNYDIRQVLNSFNYSLESSFDNVNTIGEYVQKIIYDFLQNNNIGIEMTPENKYFIDGLALSIIQFVIFLVGIILIYVLGFILRPLLYHLIFKWFIPKNTRKHHKMRFLGGFVGFVEIICVISLFLSPFTAIINSAMAGIKNEDGSINVNESNNNEIYQLITNFFEGYNNSILANTIFKITLNGKPLDVILMDFITESNISQEDKLHLMEELENIISVAYDAISQGVIDLSTGSIQLSVLFETQFVKDMLYSLSNSTLVCFTLPIALTLGLSLSEDDLNADFSNVDLSNINWSDSLKSVGDVFESIRETGIVDASSIENPNQILDNVYLNREHEVNLKNALNRLGNSDIFSELMPQLFTSILASKKSNQEQIQLKNEETGSSSFFDNLDLPEEAYQVETYQDINWGDELVNTLEIVLKMSDQFKAINNQDLPLSQINTLFTQENLMTMLLGVNESLVYDSESDYENNAYLYGGEVNQVNIPGSLKILGASSDQNNVGLLDLQLVDKLLVDFNALPQMLPSLIASLEGNGINLDLDEACQVITEEVENWDINNWKNEFNAILESAVPLMNLTKNLNSQDSMEIINSISEGEGNVALKYSSKKIESSFVLNKVAPIALEAFTENENNDRELFLGLKLSDLNFTQFENSTFAGELSYLANDVLPNLSSFVSLIEQDVNVETAIDNKDDFVNILEGVYSSQIFNPNLTEEEIANKELTNFEEVMVQILSKPTQEDINNGFDTSFNLPTITDDLIVVEKEVILNVGKSNNKDWVESDGTGEIKALFNVLGSLKSNNEGDTNYLLSFITNQDELNINEKIYEMGNEIERIFSSVDYSQIMRSSLPNTLNSLIKDVEFVGGSVDFNNIDNWTLEGESFAKTLDTIKALKDSSGETDITAILMTCDQDLLNESQFELPENSEIFSRYGGQYYKYFEDNSHSFELLKNVNQTGSIDLPNLLYSTIKQVLENSNYNLSEETLLKAEFDFKFEEGKVPFDNNSYVSWNAIDENYRGEIYNVARILASSSKIEDMANINSSEEISSLLDSLNNAYPLRSILQDVINSSLTQIKDNNISSSLGDILSEDYLDYDAFNRTMFDYSESDDNNNRLDEINARNKEIDVIKEFYDSKQDFENLDSTQFDQTIINLTNGESESKLVKLLTKMHDSELFNSQEYINSNTNEVRNKLTSFEYLFKQMFEMKNDVFREITVDEIYSLNNRTNDDGWIGENGEIIKFNNAINQVLNSEIYQKVINVSSNDSFTVLKDLYQEEANHIKELSMNLDSSYLLGLQLPKIYDNYIYSPIKNALPKYDENNTDLIDYNYVLVENPYALFDAKFSVNWQVEGEAIDSLLYNVNSNNIQLEDASLIDSSNVETLLTSFKESQVLSYNSLINKNKLIENDENERSTYEYLIACINSSIKSKIYGEDNIFEINDVEGQKAYITTKDITDYQGEYENSIKKFLTSYDMLTGKISYDVNGNTYDFLSGENIDITSFDNSKIDGIKNIFSNMLDGLASSQMFNFRNYNGEEYHVKGDGDDNYLNRTTYEYGVIYLSNKIRDALVNGFNLNEEDGYVIYKNSSNYLKDLDSFKKEQITLLDVLDVYKEAKTFIEGNISIDSISSNKDILADLFAVISQSYILNDTQVTKYINPSNKTSNYLSLYDDMVLYLINKVNTSIYEGLSLDKTTNNISVNNIKEKKILSDQNAYEMELNYILNEGGIIDLVSKLGLENTITFDISFLKENRSNLTSLLEKLSISSAYNYYVDSSSFTSTYLNEISTFEKVLLKLFNQGAFTGLIYDESNITQNERLTSRFINIESYNDEHVVLDKIIELNRNENSLDTSYAYGISLFTKNDVTGEIDKLFDLVGKLTSENESFNFSSISAGKDLLYEVGLIYIIHDIEPKQIKEISKNQSIDNDSKIKSISDLSIKNQPAYYYYESNKELYPTFNATALAYKEELDAIDNLINEVTKANVSGEINNLEPGATLFEDLLSTMETSNIYVNIAIDAIVKIFNQLSINYLTYNFSLDYFINNEPSLTDENLIAKVSYVEDNFNTHLDLISDRSELYRLEGRSFDAFLDYAIRISKGDLFATPVIDERYPNLSGYEMCYNFQSHISTLS